MEIQAAKRGYLFVKFIYCPETVQAQRLFRIAVRKHEIPRRRDGKLLFIERL